MLCIINPSHQKLAQSASQKKKDINTDIIIMVSKQRTCWEGECH